MMPYLPRPSAGRLPMLTVKQAADELQHSEKTIRRWIEQGGLHVHRLGRGIRITHKDLAAFVAVRRK